ncbi:IS110 family transposase [Brevibacterium sp. FAM 24638]
MSIVAHLYSFFIGIDTHARNHVYTIITSTGALIDAGTFPTTPAGIKRAMSWVGRRTDGDLDTLWVVEGAASYGAVLTGHIAAAGYPVVEAARMDAKARHGVGKSDELDSRRIAESVLRLDADQLRWPRQGDGVRQALRVLLAARNSMSTERTREINALTALVRTNDLGLDARKSLTADQFAEISKWRARKEDIGLATARAEAVRRAKRVLDLDEELAGNLDKLTELIKASPAAALLEEPGVGPFSAAVCFTAWSHPGRVRNEAAFAALAGVNPIPASSGNTHRHRLNRGGDRQLNRALHTVIMNRMVHDERTRKYVARHYGEDPTKKSKKEIRRKLKWYLARRVYKILNALDTVPQPA